MWSGSHRLLIIPSSFGRNIRQHVIRSGKGRRIRGTSCWLSASGSINVYNSVYQRFLTTPTDKEPNKKSDNDSTVVKETKDKQDKNDQVKKQNTKTQQLMEQIKEAGLAGIISYGFWEVAFWSASVPVVLVSYHQLTGHWPDLSDKQEVAKLSAQAFVYVNFSRLAVPLRIGLALSTTPWVQRHVVNRFLHKKKTTNKK